MLIRPIVSLRGSPWLHVMRGVAILSLIPFAAGACKPAARNPAGSTAPFPPAPDEPRRIREALLAELRPVTLKNCTLKRFGSPNDGGYLMCENLMAVPKVAYSYGIGDEDNWGCQVSRQFRIPVHQYDCFTAHRPSCKGARFVFHDECVGNKTEVVNLEAFDTLTNQISKNGDSGKPLLVKMDVDGAEWDSLLATPDAVLERIDQMPMELHGVGEARFLMVVQKLKRTFYVVNLHFNNGTCSPKADPLPAEAYQVLWVNKRLGVVDGSVRSPAPMSPLNAPDNLSMPDCQLAAAQN